VAMGREGQSFTTAWACNFTKTCAAPMLQRQTHEPWLPKGYINISQIYFFGVYENVSAPNL